MCILVSATSPRGCCKKELVIRCHLDQWCEWLYAKGGQVLADVCPKATTKVVPWHSSAECKRLYHRNGLHGGSWAADFCVADDYDLLKKIQEQQRNYDDLARDMKREFTKYGASDAVVAKALRALNDLPKDATLEDKAKCFSAMGFKIRGNGIPKDLTLPEFM